MWKKVIAAVLLISLLTVAIVQAVNKQTDEREPASQTAASQKGPAVGSKAPDFELKTLTGETVKLSDLKGKKVMLNFWATWCPPCKAEMPDMEKFHQEAGNEVTILAVNIDPQLDVQAFIDEYKITFPIPLDTDDVVNGQYDVLSIPTTYFIDTKGIIQHKFVGSMKYEDMKDHVAKLK